MHNDAADNWLKQIQTWGKELGFQQVGISDLELGDHSKHLQQWLDKQFHGDMGYMKTRLKLRQNPNELLEGTQRIITARMDYLPKDDDPERTLSNGAKAYISRYTLGRDYHKLARKRLSQLAKRIDTLACKHQYRAFVDSAPILERAFAEKSGLGWIGKNTMLINKTAGSWFFLGEIFTSLPLPVKTEQPTNHCGSCTACIDICPTKAIVAPNQLDARLCISYLTIENKGAIPEALREAMGNRVYGCDDCQLCCPWNKFSEHSEEKDFQIRHQLNDRNLLDIFEWNEDDFLCYTEGSAIRRIGYQQWLRNLCVAIGNAPYSADNIKALERKRSSCSNMVLEHLEWAIQKQQQKQNSANATIINRT